MSAPLSINRQGIIFDKWALISVLGVWAGMVAAMLSWIAEYGRNVPWAEDWVMVAALVGKQSHLMKWLWSQTMEHRAPIQRAAYLVLLKASGGDFRIGMIANAVALGGLCLATILIARRLRGGQTRLADVFFPLVFLHLGHFENIFRGWQLQFIISASLACVWLLIIVDSRWPLSSKVAVIAGITLVLLPLSGGGGMIFTPFVVLWITAGVLLFRKSMTARWIIPFEAACVFISIVLVIVYFVGYEFVTQTNPGVVAIIIASARFVGMALGPAGAAKSITGVLFCGVAFLLLASMIIPLRYGLLNTCPAERFRAFGLLIFAGAMATSTLAIGWGRAHWGEQDRYALISAPGLCAVYFAWILYGSESMRNRVTIIFAIAMLIALPFNIRRGIFYREVYVAGMQAFEQDLRGGMSVKELAERHQKFLFGWVPLEQLVGEMRMLHQARMGPWKGTAL
ncbi:MAG: hypothetical protein JO249_04630 [Acidobacteria bacterium]|nr:hypothetical protein [Acidobacteriota bacterium]